jgi:GT2 family glycosyltransferase
MPRVSGKGEPILKSLIEGNIMVVSCPLIKKEVFQSCGLFDETLKAHEDWDFWIRCALCGIRFFYYDLPDTGTLIRYHSVSMSQNRELMFKTNLQIRKKIFPLLKSREIIKLNRVKIIQTKILLALENIRSGNKLNGFLCLLFYSLINLDFFNLLYGLKIIVFGDKPFVTLNKFYGYINKKM